MLDRYLIRDMGSWNDVGADLIVTDPPFGIEFSGKNGNYNRNVENVVDGYVEWVVPDYGERINQLLDCIHKNLKENGQALIFSGWNNSNAIHNAIGSHPGLTLQGKLYWQYNFAPACKMRPAHNVYEIFWTTKGEKWFYSKRCSTPHCTHGEPNLSSLPFKRDYKRNMPKYPTRLPFELIRCILEHFSKEWDLVFDPMAGSGMLGIVARIMGREFLLGDLNENGKRVFDHLIRYYGSELK